MCLTVRHVFEKRKQGAQGAGQNRVQNIGQHNVYHYLEEQIT